MAKLFTLTLKNVKIDHWYAIPEENNSIDLIYIRNKRTDHIYECYRYKNVCTGYESIERYSCWFMEKDHGIKKVYNIDDIDDDIKTLIIAKIFLYGIKGRG
jgi:hypothetical protein